MTCMVIWTKESAIGDQQLFLVEASLKTFFRAIFISQIHF